MCSCSAVDYVTVGPDRIYTSDYAGKGIGSITYGGAQGNATGFFAQLPDGGTPQGLIEGADGAIYFTETGGKLSKLLPQTSQSTGASALITQWNDFLVGTVSTVGALSDGKGALWFTENNNASVVRMTTWGSILTRTPLTSGSQPNALALGNDGSTVWVTEKSSNKIAALDGNGTLLSEYAVPASCGSAPNFIALGGDGNMYFTEHPGTGVQGYLGIMTPSGGITCARNPDLGDSIGIAEGPDGNIWIAEYQAAALVKYDVVAHTMSAPVPLAGHVAGNPVTLVLGADGQLWFPTDPGHTMGAYHP